MQKAKPIIILNLTGELISELDTYFKEKKITVINPLAEMQDQNWTHVLTKDLFNFDQLNLTYEIISKNRQVISLSRVLDLQNFTMNNGNLIIDECWFKNTMGKFILDKYFIGYGGSSMPENYPSFKEMGSFHIVNPLSTGDYVDRLILSAFESQVEALSVKTYIDHLVMYLTALKNSGKAGIPFEVVYGVYQDVFAVQFHFFSQGLTHLDLAQGLSSTLTKKPEEYYLNVAVQAADFFDFSYMTEVKKVVATGIWTKDQRVRFENRGLMFNSLLDSAPLVQYDQSQTESSLLPQKEIDDQSERISFKGSEFLDQNGDGFENAEDLKFIKSSIEETVKQIIKGYSDANDDEVRVCIGVIGDPELQKLVRTVKQKFDDEDKDVFKVNGEKFDIDKVAFNIASYVDKTAQEQNLKIRSLIDTLPKSIRSGLYDFAKEISKEVDELTESDLATFQLQKMPEILQRELINSINVEAKKRSGEDGKYRAENQKLKKEIKALTTEVEILRSTTIRLTHIDDQAQGDATQVVSQADPLDAIREEFQRKLTEQKKLNDQDLKRLADFLDRESKLVSDLRQEEAKARKLQLEAKQKETYFAQELEGVERESKAKDLVVAKTKESLTKLIEKKDKQILELKTKLNSNAIGGGQQGNNEQIQKLKDYEKQNQSLTKQLEIMKGKLSSMSSSIQNNKNDDENYKEEGRKLQMMNQQIQNQLDLSKKEVDKLQNRLKNQANEVLSLKQDKVKLETQIKKSSLETKDNLEQTVITTQYETEMKRINSQNQILEGRLRESNEKISGLEAKLTEVTRQQKQQGSGGEDGKKAAQLEGTVKKLTQDLIASKNQLVEEKKETNKLRQEKNAMQNQLDKYKKEAEKTKGAGTKKPGGAAA